MSDSEEFLVDELGDHGADDAYNLGNEEEEILLAGGDIGDRGDAEEPRPPKIVEETQAPPPEPAEPATPTDENAAPDSSFSGPAGDQRYRADRKERFPTERADAVKGTAPSKIPESLDNVVTETVGPADRRPQNNRGRRQGNQKIRAPNGPDRRPPNPTKYSPIKRNDGPPRNAERGPPVRNGPFNGGPFFHQDGGRRFPPGPPRIDNMPNNMRTPADFQRDNRPPGRHFAPYAGPPMNPQDRIPDLRSVPFRDFSNGPPRGFAPNDRPFGAPPAFNPPHRAPSGNVGPPPFDRMRVRPGFQDSRIGHLGFPGQPPPNGTLPSEGPRNIPNEGNKVHINPHFKGPVPQGNFETGPGLSRDMNMQDHKIGVPSRTLTEEELERVAKQFIDGNRRCLERAKAIAKDEDFYEKTQRFIENTTVDVRSVTIEHDKDPKKEYLKWKQEEFINENRLNLRKRRVSPPRTVHRSPPPPQRQRHSPYKRNRPPSSHSPPQSRRETSGEPEDRDYRAKMREQAEMRAKVLQAKERRRRRDAATLSEKLNQAPAHQDPVEQSSTVINKNRPEIKSLPVDTPKQQTFEKTPAETNNSKPTVTEKPMENLKDTSKTVNTKRETLEDMLEDDLLRLSPEDEDLLLSDDDEFSLSLAPSMKLKNWSKSSSAKSVVETKPAKAVSQVPKQPNSLKRASNENSDDLRRKLNKASEPSHPLSPKSQSPQRRKIVYASDNSKEVQKPTESISKGGKLQETNNIKWRSTFSEQKLDLTGPVAARAISAVMRNSSENTGRKVISPKSKKTTVSLKASPEAVEKTASKASNGNNEDKSWTTRQVVVGSTGGRRVVIPRKPQKPLIVVENDEDEDNQSKNASIEDGKKTTTALVTGLPPGMTEARLLSLCGPEVEQVSVGPGGSADVNFVSAEACERFVRRFNGRIVAACRLTVTTSR